MKPPEFTEEQENWISEVVNNWYVSWEKRMFDYTQKINRLDYAKEELKSLLYGVPKMNVGNNGLMAGFLEPKEYLEYYAHWKCAVCGQVRDDKFIDVEKYTDDKKTYTCNVKYCNDKEKCITSAKNKQNWMLEIMD